ncbi:MAG: hypothetical protein Q8T03_05585 [Bacteroidota bacterium]|nr:hypothetical protein [Bacteroidota bacterium]
MIKRLITFVSVIISTFDKEQCRMVCDYLGNLSPKSYFVDFSVSSYNLNFPFNNNWSDCIIDSGESSSFATGISYTKTCLGPFSLPSKKIKQFKKKKTFYS